ncbi:MAG TPA: Zn-dependent alcohol dehydrogenase [Ktedonobacterales bacterium]|nr:Zn-dependent alcohol dehydrogenase [Ktedonobacterales bacterium]
MPTQTRAAVLRGYETRLAIEEITLDDPEPGEVVVRLAACGVCHSDLHMINPVFKNALPVVLGHEGAGIVERVGPQVTSVRPGDHVVITWIPSCGRCRYCASGRPALCANRQGVERRDGAARLRLHDAQGEGVHQLLDSGAFAEHVLVREEGVIPIDPDVPLEVASLVGCGVLTGVGAVARTARVEQGSVVAIFGVGGVGLNVVQGAVLAGAARIIAVDMRPAALELARQFGATDMVDASDPANANLAKVVRQMTGGGVDYSFEVVGRPETIAQAWESLVPGGRAVVVGLTPQNARVELRADFLSEKALLGCIFGSSVPRVDVPRMLSLYRSGRLKLDELVARRYPLDAVNEALDALRAGTTGRGVLTIE